MNWIDGRKELNQMKGKEHSADTEKNCQLAATSGNNFKNIIIYMVAHFGRCMYVCEHVCVHYYHDYALGKESSSHS